MELVGLGSSSSMESFSFLRSIAAEWIRKKDDWRRHFKEKMMRIGWGFGLGEWGCATIYTLRPRESKLTNEGGGDGQGVRIIGGN